MQLDVFTPDAFGMHQLTATINKLPYQPMRLGELKLFQEDGVRTVGIDIEEKSGRLTLIQSSPRGGVSQDILGEQKRGLRTFKAFHFERDSKIKADEIQGVRAFGSETDLQIAEEIVKERMTELIPMHEVTLEYHRMNALLGILLDADGSTLYNLFTEFNVVQQTQNFVFSSDTEDVRGDIVAAKRLSEEELGGEVISDYRALCGANFFDKLTSHPNVIEAYKFQQGQMLQSDLRKGFRFGDVTFEEYRSAVAKPTSVGGGTAAFISPDQAILVPVAPIYITRFAPGDYMETVNTKGLPRYAKLLPDPTGANKFVQINTQSNPICLNTRPRAIIKLTKS